MGTRLLILFLAVTIVSSCRSKSPVVITNTVHSRDTLIVTKTRTLIDTAVVHCTDSFTVTFVDTNNVRTVVTMKDSLLYVVTTCPPDTVVVTKYKITSVTKELPIVQEDDSWLSWILWVICTFIAGYIISMIINRK